MDDDRLFTSFRARRALYQLQLVKVEEVSCQSTLSAIARQFRVPDIL
jgi:hypothetical protein